MLMKQATLCSTEAGTGGWMALARERPLGGGL